ncbi:hypothetical protein GGS20DRAFT_308038 [Poronia punctata]|nr:hypothetical protein GGS20DRAFT_308038 [Poronia punctata]
MERFIGRLAKFPTCKLPKRGLCVRGDQSRIGQAWSNTWLWEISSAILSGICMVLILTLLMVYNKKPAPQFTYGLTLNAIISTLTTFCKSSLLVAVAGAIGQLKWHSFQHTTMGRSVLDTQLFDDAVRGPWGALVLVATSSRWSFVSIGALVSVLALAFEPFTQQVITYNTYQRTNFSNTALPVSNLSQAKILELDNGYTTFPIQNRFYGSMWDLSSEDETFAAVQCPTGNCTWEEFESLSVCSSCDTRTTNMRLSDPSLYWNASFTRQLLQNELSPPLADAGYSFNRTFSLEFPKDFPCDDMNLEELVITANIQRSLSNKHYYPAVVWYPRHIFTASFPTSFFSSGQEMKDHKLDRLTVSDFSDWKTKQQPLLSICHVQLDRGSKAGTVMIYPSRATLCYLTPCVKKYSFSVSNGIPRVDILKERYGAWYFNTSGLKLSDNQLYHKDTGKRVETPISPSWADVPGPNGVLLDEGGTNLSSNPSPISFGLAGALPFLDSLSDFGGQISTTDVFAVDEKNFVSNTTGIRFENGLFQDSPSFPLDQGGLVLQQMINQGGLPWAIRQMAAAANRLFRDHGTTTVVGRAYTFEITVGVRWMWLALPVITWLCGTVFLLLTIWTCRGSDRPLWKTSSLPLIYHGFEGDDMQAIRATETKLENVSGMEEYSRNLYAQIRRDPSDGKLKLARPLPAP